MKTNIGDFSDLELASSMIIINVKHTFTPEELSRESELLAQAVTDKSAEEANKKASMGVFKNKIDSLDAEVKLRAGHVTHGFTYLDKPTEMFRDYEQSKRLYFDKVSGDLLKSETFHQSDFQKKLDFETKEANRQEQIEENNSTGDYANNEPDENGMYIGNDGNLTDIKPTFKDALDEIIAKKTKPAKAPKIKPDPKYNLGDHYNKSAEFDEEK